MYVGITRAKEMLTLSFSAEAFHFPREQDMSRRNLIGFVVAHSDLQRAMLVPVVTAVGLIVMSARLPADPTEQDAA